MLSEARHIRLFIAFFVSFAMSVNRVEPTTPNGEATTAYIFPNNNSESELGILPSTENPPHKRSTDFDVENVSPYPGDTNSVKACAELTDDQKKLEKNSTEYLYLKLFGCYNKNVKAAQAGTGPVNVAVKVSIVTLEDIDMLSQKEIARILLELSWMDINLKWDPVLFEDTDKITVKAERIWLPDLIIESLDGSFEFIKAENIGQAVINHDGNVVIWPYVIVELGMKIEISRYPFDKQVVSFIFGSWSYSNLSVSFYLDEDHDPFVKYKENAEWQKLTNTTIIGAKKYDSDFYNRIGYQISFRRRWLYYVMNMIGPVVISCLLNLLVFLLPAASGQRVTLAISIFLILTIFLSQINASLPKSSVGVSILVIYLCLQIFGSVLTIFISVLIIYLNQRAETKEQPKQSKMLSLLCRSVIPKQMMAKFEVKPDNTALVGTDKQPETAQNCEDLSQARRHSKPNLRTPSESRMSQIFSRKILLMAAAYINKSCLWLSIVWNVLLLTAVIIVAASGDVSFEIPDLEKV